ncbi:hypothetical protein [Kineosporia sp. A_224]|uniref:hypothetical protein n=1 Tax=Kineosporia sp. A_224 TaxID=1962180 RepID=UPI000B4C1553|nr:hypothetical protein [Kineosporia sp. A_224]
MSSTAPRSGGPLDDDELERALSAGLSRAVDGGVDTAALVRGAHAGARRIQRRRTAVRGTVAALCVVAVVPFGVSALGGGGLSMATSDTAAGGAAAPEAVSGSAAASGEGELAGGSDGPVSAPGPVETSVRAATGSTKVADGTDPVQGEQFSAATGLRRSGGQVVVGDPDLLAAGDLGLAPVSVADDSAGAASTSTTVVRLCGSGTPGEVLARGGRTVTWAGPQVGDGAWTVATSVRVFAADGAAQQLAYLERNVGPCAQSPGVSRAGVDGLPGDDVLVAVLPESTDGAVTVVGAVRRGKVTAGVEVVVPLGAAATSEARRAAGVARVRTLLTTAYERLENLSAEAQKDQTLR